MKKLLLNICYFFLIGHLYSQGFNNSSDRSYINIAMPKTPESSSIERYGEIALDEFSGTPNISFPLYNLQGRFLQVPISLSYNASGIKVSQEATWAGLGFDINAGGRITVETKGNIDDITRYVTTDPLFKVGLSRIFNKSYGNHNTSLMRYAFLDWGKMTGQTAPGFHVNDTLWDSDFTVSNAAWYGMGEPDIFHANFNGNSVSFYIDILTDQVKFIGEKSLFSVNINRNSNGGIIKFIITDNGGTQYFFEQLETSKLTAPTHNYGGFSIYQTTTAWLLTKIQHHSGETMLFSYTNYGKIYPAFTWSANQSMVYNETLISNSPVNAQSQSEHDVYYLTKIESDNATLNFILGTRDDLQGTGARKLAQINVVNKANSIINSVIFNYDYFIGAEFPGKTQDYYKKRLRLISFKSGNNNNSPIHYFHYNNITVPSKLSFAQDHWGYCNGFTSATATNPNEMLPSFASLGALETRGFGPMRSCGIAPPPSSNGVISSAFDGAANRNCNPYLMQSMMLDSIIYPTGGSVKFTFEPHESDYQNKGISDFIGGGLRVKQIKKYSGPNVLAGITEYSYKEDETNQRTSGIYLGAINYLDISNKSSSTPVNGGSGTMGVSNTHITLSNFGDINADKLTVGYRRIKIKNLDFSGNGANGYTVKHFNVNHPYQVDYIANSSPPYQFPSPYPCASCTWDASGIEHLLKDRSAIPPVPVRDLDGKMYLEEIFDATGNIKKSINYYYRQAANEQGFYSLKAEDNILGFQGILIEGFDCAFSNRWIRWSLCLNPAKSFFTVLDSVVEKTYAGSSFIQQKNAFKYNSYSQLEYKINDNSDGTQSIQRYKTPLSFPTPNYAIAPVGNAAMISQMKSDHIYDPVLESIYIQKTLTGDSLVTGGRFDIYQGTNLKYVYALETATPLTLPGQFQHSYYDYANYPGIPSNPSAGYTLKIDPRYKLNETANYNTHSLINEVLSGAGNKAFIWDEFNNNLLAASANSISTDIAFSSFESLAKGNWTYSGFAVTDNTAPTGKKVYQLSGGSITKSGLNSSSTYLLTYWTKNGSAFSIAGTQTGYPINKFTINGWKYFEHKISGQSAVAISGSGFIDELRLHPFTALMTTYAYDPLVGIINQTDAGNRISRYYYDELNRLILIKDQDNNILKKICYNYAGQTENCNIYFNTVQSGSASKQCSAGYTGSTHTYIVPANTYISTIDVSAANAKAQADVNTNKQDYANSVGTCTFSQIPINYSNYTSSSFSAQFYNNATSVSYYFTFNPYTGNSTIGQVPAGNYMVIIYPASGSSYNISVGANYQYGTSSFYAGNVQIDCGSCGEVYIDYY